MPSARREWNLGSDGVFLDFGDGWCGDVSFDLAIALRSEAYVQALESFEWDETRLPPHLRTVLAEMAALVMRLQAALALLDRQQESWDVRDDTFQADLERVERLRAVLDALEISVPWTWPDRTVIAELRENSRRARGHANRAR
jgi:hypothetical protein